MASRLDLAASLLRCPVGCAFLLSIERDEVPADVAVTAPQAFARAAVSLGALNPWSADFAEALPAALARGSRLASLAQELVAHPGSAWWTAPLNRSRQALVVDDATHPPDSPEAHGHWEDYAHRPVGWRITSTLRGGYSCLDAVIASGVGDWLQPSAYLRFEARIAASARVYEIAGPADWHALCVSHPRINQNPSSPAGAGTLVPDWGRVARQWDGVHLTFMGLLTAPFVRHSSAAGTSMLWSWDSEGVMWLPGEFVRSGSPLAAPDHDEQALAVVARLRAEDFGTRPGGVQGRRKRQALGDGHKPGR